MEVNLVLDETAIIRMKKEQYKTEVKKHVRAAACKNLQQIKEKHSKMNGLEYNKLELQKYMQSPLFTCEATTMLFALRTRTVRGIREDFGKMFGDKYCPLKCGDIDTLKNVLTCKVLQTHLKSQSVAVNQVKYEDVFSPDISKKEEVTEVFIHLINIRESLLNTNYLPVSITVPVH